MRKLIMWNLITLDGYFEGDNNWDLDFHNTVWGPELEALSLEQLHKADYLVFGRVTYEGMAAYWKTAEGAIANLMNQLPKMVFSKTLKEVDWNNSELAKGDVAETIKKAKSEGNGDMYVFGSSILSETLLNENLFDELRIVVAPIILGSGRPLFRNGVLKEKNLTLTSSTHLDTGGMILRYQLAGN